MLRTPYLFARGHKEILMDDSKIIHQKVSSTHCSANQNVVFISVKKSSHICEIKIGRSENNRTL